MATEQFSNTIMTQNITISAYKVMWVEFRAVKGIVTKKDAKILRKYTIGRQWRNGDRIQEHFGSKEAALEYLRTKDFSKLSKHYEVRLCTDKQFGMGHMENGSNIINFTSKQNAEMYII